MAKHILLLFLLINFATCNVSSEKEEENPVCGTSVTVMTPDDAKPLHDCQKFVDQVTSFFKSASEEIYRNGSKMNLKTIDVHVPSSWNYTCHGINQQFAPNTYDVYLTDQNLNAPFIREGSECGNRSHDSLILPMNQLERDTARAHLWRYFEFKLAPFYLPTSMAPHACGSSMLAPANFLQMNSMCKPTEPVINLYSWQRFTPNLMNMDIQDPVEANSAVQKVIITPEYDNKVLSNVKVYGLAQTEGRNQTVWPVNLGNGSYVINLTNYFETEDYTVTYFVQGSTETRVDYKSSQSAMNCCDKEFRESKYFHIGKFEWTDPSLRKFYMFCTTTKGMEMSPTATITNPANPPQERSEVFIINIVIIVFSCIVILIFVCCVILILRNNGRIRNKSSNAIDLQIDDSFAKGH